MKIITAIFAAAALCVASASAQEVVDAWHYTGVPDGTLLNAAVAGCASTGTVGGVKWGTKTWAAVYNQAQRWKANHEADAFTLANPSKYDSATSGKFQLEYELVSADFTATAALTNGQADLEFHLRQTTGSTKDMGARIRFDGRDNVQQIVGGVTNFVNRNEFQLMVVDQLTGGAGGVTRSMVKTIATGSTISNLKIRQVYDLDNAGTFGSFEVFYKLGAAPEVAAYTGTVWSAFVVDSYRSLFSGNLAKTWALNDTAYIDNIIYTKLTDPVPPPAYTLIDLWNYNGLANGSGLSLAKSTGYVGNVSFVNADMCVVSNNMLLFKHDSLTNSQESVFRQAPLSAYAAATTGIYELAWDYVAADFANSDAVDGTGNVGMTVRSLSAATNSMGFKLRFNGNDFTLQMEDANSAYATKATFAGSTISNLSVRMVMNLDNAGAAGSAVLLYSLDGGDEVFASTDGVVHPGFKLTEYRMVSQSINGGNSWALGDTVWTDNLRFEKVASMPVTPTPSSLFADWATAASLGSATNLTDNPDADALNNLGEYAFNGDPADDSDLGYVPFGTKVNVGGTNYIDYVYIRRKDNAKRGLSYTLKLNDDLVYGSWTNNTSLYTNIGAADLPGGEFRAVTNRVIMDAGKRFIRTDVTFTP